MESTVISKYPADDLLKKAEEFIDKFQYDVAEQFCKRSMEVEPNNMKAQEMMAGLLIEFGNPDGAKTYLAKAIELNPNAGHTKYFSLAQLLEGKDSVDMYKRGIEVLLNHISTEENKSNINKELSTAYCALAELYMTDCCYDDNAEEECKGYINKAIDSDTNNAEAYQCMASFLLVKDQKKEAKEMIEKSVSLWLPHALDILEGKSNEMNVVEVCEQSYASRINAVKILIELEMYEMASDVLECLVAENDEIVEVWYLHGFTNYLKGNEYKTNARYYLSKAKKVSQKQSDVDEQILQHIDELLQELGDPDENDEINDENKENLCLNDEFSIESSGDEQEMDC